MSAGCVAVERQHRDADLQLPARRRRTRRRSRGRSPSGGRSTTASGSRALRSAPPARVRSPGRAPQRRRSRVAWLMQPSSRSNSATHSMCGVWGNMSTGRTLTSRSRRRRSGGRWGPASSGCRRRRRSAAAASRAARRTTFCERPARGGSTTTTSGRRASLGERAERRAGVAGEEVGVVDLVQARVLDRVRDRLLCDVDAPDLGRSAARARGSASRCRSRCRRRARCPPRPAYSAASS